MKGTAHTASTLGLTQMTPLMHLISGLDTHPQLFFNTQEILISLHATRRHSPSARAHTAVHTHHPLNSPAEVKKSPIYFPIKGKTEHGEQRTCPVGKESCKIPAILEGDTEITKMHPILPPAAFFFYFHFTTSHYQPPPSSPPLVSASRWFYHCLSHFTATKLCSLPTQSASLPLSLSLLSLS